MKSKEIPVNKPFFSAKLFDYGSVLELVILTKDPIEAIKDCQDCDAYNVELGSSKSVMCTGIEMQENGDGGVASIYLDARQGTADEKLICGAKVLKQTYKR